MPGSEADQANFGYLLSIYRVPIIFGAVSLLFIALSITLFIKSYQANEPITFSSHTEQDVAGVASESAQTTLIAIDIEGAVVKPGLYRLTTGSRVDDAITIAGGFSRDADLHAVSQSINKAAKLSDGAKLYIPTKGELPVGANPSLGSSSTSGQSGAISGLVNINNASEAQLEALSGVGPVTAGKIIAGRPYMRLEELVEKKALGQSLFNKLKDQITL